MNLLFVNKGPLNFIKVFLISTVLFFAFTMPFHKILSVFTVSEVRFSAVLYPFLGVNYGLPAALGIAFANFLSDTANGYPPNIIIEGILPQILYVMIPRIIWRYFVRSDEHKHRLDSVKRVLQFALVCFISAFLAACFVGYFCVKNYGLNFMQVAKFVFLNNFEISLILGCPLMIVANQIVSRRLGIDRIVTFNERIILISAITEVIILFSLVYFMYSSGITLGTYDIWNSIYFCLVSVVAFLLLLTLIIMIIFEFATKKNNKYKN